MSEKILVLQPGITDCELCHKMLEGYSGTTILFLRIPSVDLCFTRYFANEQLLLNGVPAGRGLLNFRTHFFAPSKNISGKSIDTYAFKIAVLFLSSFVLYLILYFDLLSVTFKLIARYRT